MNRTRIALAVGAVAAIVAGGATAVADIHIEPASAPDSSIIDTPEPGDTPDEPDIPEPGDTPDAPGHDDQPCGHDNGHDAPR